jgi:hypothetical protein
VKTLEEFGVKHVHVHPEPPPFEPVMVRGTHALAEDPDWLVRMYGSGQRSSLLDAVHHGATADEAGTSFVPALARAVDFGRQGPVRPPEPGKKPEELMPRAQKAALDLGAVRRPFVFAPYRHPDPDPGVKQAARRLQAEAAGRLKQAAVPAPVVDHQPAPPASAPKGPLGTAPAKPPGPAPQPQPSPTAAGTKLPGGGPGVPKTPAPQLEPLPALATTSSLAARHGTPGGGHGLPAWVQPWQELFNPAHMEALTRGNAPRPRPQSSEPAQYGQEAQLMGRASPYGYPPHPVQGYAMEPPPSFNPWSIGGDIGAGDAGTGAEPDEFTPEADPHPMAGRGLWNLGATAVSRGYQKGVNWLFGGGGASAATAGAVSTQAAPNLARRSLARRLGGAAARGAGRAMAVPGSQLAFDLILNPEGRRTVGQFWDKTLYGARTGDWQPYQEVTQAQNDRARALNQQFETAPLLDRAGMLIAPGIDTVRALAYKPQGVIEAASDMNATRPITQRLDRQEASRRAELIAAVRAKQERGETLTPGEQTDLANWTQAETDARLGRASVFKPLASWDQIVRGNFSLNPFR